jgi:DNA-directed RNA polymerase subunit E'/Rpb7
MGRSDSSNKDGKKGPVVPGAEDNCLREVKLAFPVHLHPSRFHKISQAIEEHVNRLLMKYTDSLGGVLMSYSRISFKDAKGQIFTSHPHVNFPVRVRGVCFIPQKNSQVRAQISKIGKDHIGLVVHGCFHASVLNQNLPTGFRWSHSSNAFKRDADDRVLAVGDDVVACILDWRSTDQFFSLKCSITDALENMPEEEELTDEEGDSKATATSSSSAPAPSSSSASSYSLSSASNPTRVDLSAPAPAPAPAEEKGTKRKLEEDEDSSRSSSPDVKRRKT